MGDRHRAGALRTRVEADGQITVDLGSPRLPGAVSEVRASPMPTARPGSVVFMPNPHVVVNLNSVDELAELDLTRSPAVTPALATGQNVEFVAELGDHYLVMRVHERGSGETRSCGTGIAAVVATRLVDEDPEPWRVDVPGGTCTVRRSSDGHLWLTGPAIIVGRIELDSRWLEKYRDRDRQPAAISG